MQLGHFDRFRVSGYFQCGRSVLGRDKFGTIHVGNHWYWEQNWGSHEHSASRLIRDNRCSARGRPARSRRCETNSFFRRSLWIVQLVDRLRFEARRQGRFPICSASRRNRTRATFTSRRQRPEQYGFMGRRSDVSKIFGGSASSLATGNLLAHSGHSPVADSIAHSQSGVLDRGQKSLSILW